MKRNRFQFVRHNSYPAILDSKQNRVANFVTEDSTRRLVDRLNAGRTNPDGFEWDRIFRECEDSLSDYAEGCPCLGCVTAEERETQ